MKLYEFGFSHSADNLRRLFVNLRQETENVWFGQTRTREVVKQVVAALMETFS